MGCIDEMIEMIVNVLEPRLLPTWPRGESMRSAL